MLNPNADLVGLLDIPKASLGGLLGGVLENDEDEATYSPLSLSW